MPRTEVFVIDYTQVTPTRGHRVRAFTADDPMARMWGDSIYLRVEVVLERLVVATRPLIRSLEVLNTFLENTRQGDRHVSIGGIVLAQGSFLPVVFPRHLLADAIKTMNGA